MVVTPERFMARWADQLNATVVHGVGGSFDVVAGFVERAPEAVVEKERARLAEQEQALHTLEEKVQQLQQLQAE